MVTINNYQASSERLDINTANYYQSCWKFPNIRDQDGCNKLIFDYTIQLNKELMFWQTQIDNSSITETCTRS